MGAGASLPDETRLSRMIFLKLYGEQKPLVLNQIKSAFMKFDENHDSKIDKREFRQAAKFLDVELKISDEKVEELINMFDGDGDGKISLLEFISFMERNALNSEVGAKLEKHGAIGTHRRLFDELFGESLQVMKDLMSDPDHIQRCADAAMSAAYGDVSKTMGLQEDVKALVKERTAATLEQIWTTFDTDRSGALDASELYKLLVEMLQVQQATQVEVVIEQTGAMIHQTVDSMCSMDREMDGLAVLKVQKFVKEMIDGILPPLKKAMDKVFSELLQNATQVSAALLIAMDTDHDGMVELNELLDWQVVVVLILFVRLNLTCLLLTFSFHEAMTAVVQTEKRILQVAAALEPTVSKLIEQKMKELMQALEK
jgi:Ca2+-binding EF-hand superfamily protein